jgi:hypothetical protein
MIRDANKAVSTVDLAVVFKDEHLVIAMSELGAVNRRELRRNEGHLGELQDNIDRALDRLFTGF